MNVNFVAFTDESYITAERFRSIASYSMPFNILETVEIELNSILVSSNVREFKWEKLKDARYRFCAIKIIDYIIDSIINNNIRIDIVIWDTYDSRHCVRNRNDDANFERMFFHLLTSSMKRRPHLSKWGIYPDEKNEIDWNTIKSCLKAVGQWRDNKASIFAIDFFSDQFFHIEELQQVISKERPPSQVADLFAGLGVFSKTHYSKYKNWLLSQSLNFGLFDQDQVEEKLSNREKARFEVLRYFNEKCKLLKLGVSLESKCCLNTPNPKNPINFWTYVPQHEFDKAPTKIINTFLEI